MHAGQAPKLRDRLSALMRKKHTLNARIHDELRRPKPDALRLQTLKRLRLRIKDQVAGILRQLREGGRGQAGDAA